MFKQFIITALILSYSNCFSTDKGNDTPPICEELNAYFNTISEPPSKVIFAYLPEYYRSEYEWFKYINLDTPKGLPSVFVVSNIEEKVDLSILNKYDFFELKIEMPNPVMSNLNLSTKLLSLEELNPECYKQIKNNKSVVCLTVGDQDKNLKDLAFLEKFPNLKALNLWGCKQLEDLSSLKNTDIKILFISNCPKINNFDAISELKLCVLGFSHFQKLASLESISRMSLKELHITECNISNFEQIAKLSVQKLFLTKTNLDKLDYFIGNKELILIDIKNTPAAKLPIPKGITAEVLN